MKHAALRRGLSSCSSQWVRDDPGRMCGSVHLKLLHSAQWLLCPGVKSSICGWNAKTQQRRVTEMRNEIPCRVASSALILLILFWPLKTEASRCKAPSTRQIERARIYIATLHRFDLHAINLATSEPSGESCFWKLQFEITSPNKNKIIAYLSPNRQFLSSDVVDLKVDPIVEERRRHLALTQALGAGTPPSRGPAEAAVTIVEFADFECPYCGRLSNVMEKELKEDSSIRVVFRNFPLVKHPWARIAAEISQCAVAQKEVEFWKLHDFLFSNQGDLSQANVHDKAMAFVAKNTDLDVDKFKHCVDEHQSAGVVDRDIELGLQNGVHATPTIFVNGIVYEGARDGQQLQAIVAAARRGDVWPVSVSLHQSNAPVVTNAEGIQIK